ncbi:putative beta-lactamase family protein [Diplodia seriata]|uniref:Putative beta-lactamase family protein n=1 Tax=Diplodia seriata TaxID=420778 RepID=A0A0G2EAG5_9PEZI|nr:putative beta-lactamase family protein [Diplodia seriata]
MSFNAEAQATIKSTLDAVTSTGSVPGIVFVAVDKNGDLVTSHCSGTTGATGATPMSLDSVFWIASCTKIITGIACMQLVEQGKLSLDDSDALYKIIPELKDKKVLQDDGSLVPKKKEITLRMLLDHTAGFGYTFFNPKLRDWGRPLGFDEFSGDARDILDAPLVNQPGSTWEYGTNIDWAGLAVERVSGLTLNDYFHKHIFEPLGIENVSMFPTDDMLKRLVYLHQKHPDGSVTEQDHLLRRGLMAKTPEERARIVNSGGAGCFAKPVEYCQILAALLNNGTSPKTGAALLSPASVAAMFANSLPAAWPDFARAGIPAAKPHQTNPIPELYAQPGNPPQGWGLTFLLTNLDGEAGKKKEEEEQAATWRGRNTGHWAGIANLYYWVDREKGLAGMIASQVLPFADVDVVLPWVVCEKAVYDGLGK